MKKIILTCMCLVCCLTPVFANDYIETKVGSHTIKMIQYNTKDKNYNFKVVHNENGSATSLYDLMKRNNGISAVNGTFFCPADYEKCEGKDFTHSQRYEKGKRYSTYDDTGDNVVFALDEDNKAFLYQTDLINKKREKEIYYGLGNFPLFLNAGDSALDYYEKKDLLVANMKTKGSRHFICSDKESQKIMTGFVSNASVYDMPDILRELGCYHALNLDAGGSSSMIYNGKQFMTEGRKILDGVVIEVKGLNVGQVDMIIDSIIDKIQEKGALKSEINTMIGAIGKIRKQIYEENSIDLFNDQGNKIGYEIHIYKKSTMIKVYVLNAFATKLRELL